MGCPAGLSLGRLWTLTLALGGAGRRWKPQGAARASIAPLDSGQGGSSERPLGCAAAWDVAEALNSRQAASSGLTTHWQALPPPGPTWPIRPVPQTAVCPSHRSRAVVGGWMALPRVKCV